MTSTPLVLASTSIYRRELLERLRLPFTQVAPQVDETVLPGESAPATALRLAEAKAKAGALQCPDCLIIGSDQTAEVDGQWLEKPGNHERARAQLLAASGRRAEFHSALALFDATSGRLERTVVSTQVWFRELSPALVEAYLLAEKPYDCAGSAKAEGLGIALLRQVSSEDPTALIGLPLIALTGLLLSFGISPILSIN